MQLWVFGEPFCWICHAPAAANKMSGSVSLGSTSLLICHVSHSTTKPAKWHVHSVKTAISLGIHQVWSEPSLCAQWVAKDSMLLHVDSEDWSDWVDAQANLSLHWAHRSFCWFCHALAHVGLDDSWNLKVYVYKMSRIITRKPVFGVYDQLRLKPTCSADETSYCLEILAIASRGIILSRQRTTTALIRMRGCNIWVTF